MMTTLISQEENNLLGLRFQPMTLQEVAILLGTTREEVRAAEIAALRTLREGGYDMGAVLEHYNPSMAERHRR